MLWGGDVEEDGSAEASAALTVTVATPGRVIWTDSLSAQGVISAWQEASIGTQVGSYQLIDVKVNVGDQVRRGQVLARLNPALLRAEEAELVARQMQAAANDARARGLQEVGGISDQEALQFATEARTAAALLAAKRLELRYTAIVAPDDGVISARMATLGAVVPAGQELFRMIRQNRLEWRGELDAEQLKSVRKGQAVALTLPDGGIARAVVRQVAPALTDTSRLAVVYADIVPGSIARAEMYVSGAIAVGDSPALVVPAECVVIRDGRSFVILAPGSAKTAKVTLRGVTTGRRNGGLIEIERGLSGSERLVQRGAAFLKEGDPVAIARPGKAQP
ncbi:MAG: efflux RND transporter periplasmic adaptor subunit [Sphingopyxis macrogoltabida]|uniref:Efflux RND transporter periplasmic adaptor subunit n=1 Tax=Sphingopyxis macrogoltabida TaxID=33050 RepID=A0A2W5KXN1_SPHMC|nr:MAG: efflux RND transporter periplasmic adaptor subunit [Sphingopyxis macrogoltabida]